LSDGNASGKGISITTGTLAPSFSCAFAHFPG
jgi:hypothetical protein